MTILKVWKTRNIRSLLPSEDKNDHKLCVIYKGDCSYSLRYIGETKRNAKVIWNEDDNPIQNHKNNSETTATANFYGL